MKLVNTYNLPYAQRFVQIITGNGRITNQATPFYFCVSYCSDGCTRQIYKADGASGTPTLYSSSIGYNDYDFISVNMYGVLEVNALANVGPLISVFTT